jgi:hypothetical protein
MVEASMMTEILMTRLYKNNPNLLHRNLSELLRSVVKLEGILAKLSIWDRRELDRKLVTKSTLAFLDFVKRSMLDKASLDKIVLSRPMMFRKAPTNLFKGTMFETDFDFSSKVTVSTKKAPTVKSPSFGGAKDKFGFDF